MRLVKMYGRDEVLTTIALALHEPGALVTLTGLPGSGRTTVARAAAHAVAGPQGPCVVEGRTTRTAALRSALDACPTADLVLVDDVDLVPGSRELLSTLLRSRPDGRFLLTSSTPLSLDDEVVVRLPPLPLPDPTEDPELLRAHPAVQLFLDVATRTGTEVAMRDAEVAHVARICGLLGGLPLAIALVAARTAAYSPATLIELLAREPTLLLRGRDGGGEEHDLVAAVALSLSLVSPNERGLLEALTVFHGPVDVNAVLEVCDRPGVIDELSALVDVHLVEPRHTPLGSRFSLPPLVRGHLAAAATRPLAPEVLLRHRRWARRVAHDAVTSLRAGRVSEVRGLVGMLEDDLDAALVRAVDRNDAADASVLLLALLTVWANRGSTPEVVHRVATVRDLCAQSHAATRPGGATVEVVVAAWHELLRAECAGTIDVVTQASATLDDLRERARAVGGRALLEVTCLAVQASRALPQRDRPEQWAHEGLELATRLDDQVSLARLETWCGMFAHQRGDLVTAARWARQSLDRSRRLDEPSLVLRPSALLRGMPRDHGRPDDVPPLEQLVQLAHACGDLGVLDWLEPTAAFSALNAGDLAGAAERSAATLRRVHATGARMRAGPPLLCLLLLAVRIDDLRMACRLRGILSHHDQLLTPALPPHVAAIYDRAIRTLKAAALTRPGLATEAARGNRLTFEEGLELALGYAAQVRNATSRASTRTPGSSPTPAADTRSTATAASTATATAASTSEVGRTLTGRELDVLARLVSGGTNRDISRELGISAKTVMHHTSAIYRKLGVRGRAEAVAWYLRHNTTDDTSGTIPDLRLVQGDAGQ